MASIYDMAMGTMDSYAQGQQTGRQNRLRDLMGQAVSGPRENRPALLGQAAQVDPMASLKFGQAMREDDGARMGQVAKIASLIDSAPEDQKATIYAQVAPEMNALGIPVPQQWDASFAPHIRQIAQAYGGLGESAGLREFGALTSGLTPDEVARARKIKLGLAPREVGAARKAVTIKLRNGQEVPGEFDPELGYTVYDASQNAMVPLGRGDIAGVRDQGGQGQPAPTQNDMEGDIALANSMIAAGIPEAQVDAFLRNRGQRAEQPGAVAPSGIQSMVGSQTPGEQSYVQETGKTQAQLDSGDAVTRMEAERAAAKARAEAVAKAQAEVDTKAATRTRDADQTLALLEEAERILPQATGSRAGSVRDSIAGMAGIATEGAKASDSLKIIAAELVAKVPRFEGPQSNIDVQFYREAAGDLANDQLPVERRMAALQTIRRLRQKYASAQPAKRSYTQQEALQKLQDARRAIGSGADREAVRQRLRDLGLNNIAERL